MPPLRRSNAAYYRSLRRGPLPEWAARSARSYECATVDNVALLRRQWWASGSGGRGVANTNRASRKSPIPLPNGAIAPAIVLPAGHARTWALRDFRGQPVVLVFYPADWEPVSTDQLRRCNDVLPEVRSLGAELVGVSVDGVWCHQMFMHDLRLEFRLLSDFHPRGGAACAYGAYRPRQETSGRALFVVDAAGVIRWHYLAPPEVNPGVDGILTALEGLAQGKESTYRGFGHQLQ